MLTNFGSGLPGILFTLCIAATSSCAQAGDSNHKPRKTFDVVSIKPSNVGANESILRIRADGDEYEVRGMPLSVTILMAFFPMPMQSKERISGAPSWIWDEKFDVTGKVSADDLEKWRAAAERGFGTRNPMLEEMLQNALAERCKLVVHRVPATRSGYALVISKHGVNGKNLMEAKAGDAIPEIAFKIPFNGRMVPILSPDEPTMKFFGTSMKSLAEVLSRFGAPIIDRTGLIGTYRFDLTRLSSTRDPGVDIDVAALGLRLEPIQIPTETIVIDHIERPSPN
jgi:uncharacterized protein (TIGR03435 family)